MNDSIMPGYFWRAAFGMGVLAFFSVVIVIVQRVPLVFLVPVVGLWGIAGFTFARAVKVRKAIDMEPVWEQARNGDLENFQSEMRTTVRPRFVVLGWVALTFLSCVGAVSVPLVYLMNR